jgi:hypothetical protein
VNHPPLSPALTFLVEYLDLPEATGIPDATWETFQLRHLNNLAMLGITDKSRQVGWSWLAAAESVAIACLEKRSTSIFTSINLDEATEKIRYAKAVIEALDKEVRPTLIIDNRMELEYSNGSRLLSHPCRPIRGKARARVYLDEFAHYARDLQRRGDPNRFLSSGSIRSVLGNLHPVHETVPRLPARCDPLVAGPRSLQKCQEGLQNRARNAHRSASPWLWFRTVDPDL